MVERGVLIVDDDAGLLDALSRALLLRLPDLKVRAADSAAAALDLIATEDFDAIISDIKMPGTDGLQLLARMASSYPDTPVLLITGHGETELAISALRAGAYDLIQKPIDRDYFIAALERALEARHLRRDVREKQQRLEDYARELEQRVLERTAELLRANRAKDEFLGLVSHELRTPVTVILGNAELLTRQRQSLSPDAHHQALQDLRSEAWRLHRFIENLLVLARAEHNHDIVPEPVLLHVLVEGQARAHRASFPARSLDLHLPSERPLVLAHDTHVELILRNLLSNAEKYSPPESPIEVELRVADDEAAVLVSDYGIGIKAGEEDAIFGAFYRSDNVAASVSGVGIGLAVCRRLIEMSRGHIWAKRRAGGGSEFGFSLPLLKASADDPAPESEPQPVASVPAG